MKKTFKIIFYVAVSLLFIAMICFGIYEIGTSKKEAPKSLNELIIEDYHSVADTLSEGTSFFFYEVETVLNGEIDTTPIDSIRVVDYKLIAQTEKNVHFIHRNLDEGTRDVETVEGDTWAGCFQIASPIFEVSFEEALKAVTTSQFETPHTKYMTLRRPLGIRYDNPIYIFGNSMNGGLCVDSKTGEVRIFE